jgi:hypothetical protein
MNRQTYVRRNGKVVEKDRAEPIRSTGPYLNSDTMNAMRHPITGKFMDSKSSFRAITRAHGCVEVGNETMRDTRKITGMDSGTRRADIARAIQELGG